MTQIRGLNQVQAYSNVRWIPVPGDKDRGLGVAKSGFFRLTIQKTPSDREGVQTADKGLLQFFL